MSQHPKLHDPDTLEIELQPLFGRENYTPCNEVASDWIGAWGKKAFNRDEILFIQSLGYTVLVLENRNGKAAYKEFK